MDTTTLLIIFGLLGLAALVGVAILLGFPDSFGGASLQRNIKTIVSTQRNTDVDRRVTGSQRNRPDLLKSVQDLKQVKKIDSRLTLRKRLKYAQWSLPPVAYYSLSIGISLLVFAIVNMKMNRVMGVLSLVSGPIFMSWLLNIFVERRFKKFDSDYPQFLLSLVGLLKTGMTVMGALESAAQGLEDGSMVKQEVNLMIERLRFGVSEDKSIGSFGEDIYHSEIELFVQALLLSRRVGGNLSDTLERLAKQVRKRQYFRSSATAAVSMQRGSIWVIIGILAFIEGYIYMMYPALVRAGIDDPVGWQVWQGAIVLILLGIFWVRQVTKMRI